MKTTQKFQNISVKGFIEINGEYTLPTSDGNFGDIMITDGVGNSTWQPPSALILSTDDITEGSNLYYTNERVDDRVALLIQNGTGLNWTYVDGSNTLTGNVTLASFNTGNLAEGVNLYYTNERVDDRVAALMTDTATITWTYNDILNTLEANALGSPIDIQKAGSLIGSRTKINFIEGSGISLSIADNGASNRVDVIVTNSSLGMPGTLYRILSNSVIIGDDDVEALDFSSKFSVIESPDKFINIDINMSIEDLSDITLSSPIANKDILQYNSSLGQWENTNYSLYSLLEVEPTTSPNDGDVLIYNGLSGKWISSTISSHKLSWTWRASKNALTTNSYLKHTDGLFTNVNPYIVSIISKIKILTISTENVESWTGEIRVDSGSGYTTVATLTASSESYKIDNSLNILVNPGDKIALYCNGTNILNPVIDIILIEE